MKMVAVYEKVVEERFKNKMMEEGGPMETTKKRKLKCLKLTMTHRTCQAQLYSHLISNFNL